MKARIEEATGLGQHRLSIEPGAPGHGQPSVIHRLTQLTERGPAISGTGATIKDASAIATEARAWRRDLRSFSPRDTMHMIVSAKAGTDVEAFTNSVRGFLHEQFADHKFMFGVHTDKADAGHIHAHAIVTVRNGDGQKITPGPQDFRGVARSLRRTCPGEFSQNRRDERRRARVLPELWPQGQGHRRGGRPATARPGSPRPRLCRRAGQSTAHRQRPAAHRDGEDESRFAFQKQSALLPSSMTPGTLGVISSKATHAIPSRFRI